MYLDTIKCKKGNLGIAFFCIDPFIPKNNNKNVEKASNCGSQKEKKLHKPSM